MNVIPWRIKNFLSEKFPLAYHLVVNVGKGNDPEHWDRRLAETWDQRDWPTKTELIASLTKLDDRILDIGCGTGSILRSLKLAGYKDLHGLELSSYAVQRLRNEGLNMHYGKLPYLPLPDAHFDVVIASQVLEHIIRRRLFLREVRRILKPGGQALIFVPNDCLGPIDEPEHVTKFDHRKLEKELSRHMQNTTVTTVQDANFEISLLFGRCWRNQAIGHLI